MSAMKRFLIIFAFPLLFTSCKAPYELVRTGPAQPPLAKDAEIKVVSWSEIDKYEQIAIVDVGEFTLDKRMKYAMDAARAAGGEFIAAKLSGDEAKDKRSEYLVQSFVILKKKAVQETAVESKETAVIPKVSEAIPPEEKKIIPEEKDEIPAETTDYSSLPRASFRMLLKETGSLKGEKFRGSLYPVKYFKVPPELRKQTASDKQLLMLSNQSGSAKVLLILPRDRYHDMQDMIKSKKRLDFVYTPITVYRSKYPVLEYIDTIK